MMGEQDHNWPKALSSPSPRQVTLASLSCWLFEGKEFYGTEVKPSNKKNLLFNNGAEQRQLPAHRAGTVPHWFPMDNPAFAYPKHLNSDGPVHECSKHVLLSASHWPRFAPIVFSLFFVRAALYAPNSWILEGKEKTQNNQERTWFATSWILENTRLQILSVTCRNKQKKANPRIQCAMFQFLPFWLAQSFWLLNLSNYYQY